MICPKCGKEALYREKMPLNKKTAWAYIHDVKTEENRIYGRYTVVTLKCEMAKKPPTNVRARK